MPMLALLSPLDARYAAKVEKLLPYMSECALIKYRVKTELAWLKALAQAPFIPEVGPFSGETYRDIDAMSDGFGEEEALQIKAIEMRTNHDVKAVEYWLREYFAANDEILPALSFIHFACTSDDINNLAYAAMLRDAKKDVLLPALAEIIEVLVEFSHGYAAIPMLARTHGQPASPTTLGKECANFAYRLSVEYQGLKDFVFSAKFNGAVGNYNAHIVAYPEVDWPSFCQHFAASMGFSWTPYTTQIEPRDNLASFFNSLARINTILLDLDRDFWGYISLGYFRQRAVEGEVGSSTMPHKVNPIDFENSEGNLGLANALLDHMARKLPVSRWQRDLSDSTVLRNVGVALGHILVAFQATLAGLRKLDVDEERLREDLDHAWEVLAEPIQTVLRRLGQERSYERLKDATRGKRSLTQKDFLAILESLELPQAEQNRLAALTPFTYTGLAEKLAREISFTP
jgi:adenylosuccinate lyase